MKIIKCNFIISIFFHIVVFLIISIKLLDKNKFEKNQFNIVKSYFYTENNTHIIKKMNDAKKKKSDIIFNKKMNSFKNKNFQVKNNKIPENNNLLLQIIYNAISAKKYYPQNIPTLEREKIVKIKFSLNINGQISNIAIQESSGIEDLDLAAIDAVQSVPLIKEAYLYIKNEKIFLVNIIFKN